MLVTSPHDTAAGCHRRTRYSRAPQAPRRLVDGAERLLALRVSPEMLPLLQVPPAAGRLLARTPAGLYAREVVISHGLWQRRFGGGADAVGQSIRLDGEPYTIVGVIARL